jgi:hypothetical protein
MRRWRRATAGAALAVLALLAAPAGAVTYVGLHDLTCDGVTTEGTGLPASTRLEVALVDPVSQRTLVRGQPTTSAAGAFEWRAKVSLSGMRRIRAVIRRPGATPLAWAEQKLPSACPLASTGPDRTLPLVGVGLSSFTLGVLLLVAFSYQGRHLAIAARRPATPGRHLAEPYRGRHLTAR